MLAIRLVHTMEMTAKRSFFIHSSVSVCSKRGTRYPMGLRAPLHGSGAPDVSLLLSCDSAYAIVGAWGTPAQPAIECHNARRLSISNEHHPQRHRRRLHRPYIRT